MSAVRVDVERTAIRLSQVLICRVLVQVHVTGRKRGSRRSEREQHSGPTYFLEPDFWPVWRDFLLIKRIRRFARHSAKGYGRARPVGSNSTDSGREKNRRVEVVRM